VTATAGAAFTTSIVTLALPAAPQGSVASAVTTWLPSVSGALAQERPVQSGPSTSDVHCTCPWKSAGISGSTTVAPSVGARRHDTRSPAAGAPIATVGAPLGLTAWTARSAST
jgi:hypothetical protein